MASDMGYRFELYSADLLRDSGKVGVRHNVQYNIRKRFSKKLVKKVQIDIEYWDLLGRASVECKYHASSNVTLPEVEKFAQSLRMLNRNYAVMMTNAEYSSGAARAAARKGIRLLDYKDLERMEATRGKLVKFGFSRVSDLERIIREVNLVRGYRNPQIQEYLVI